MSFKRNFQNAIGTTVLNSFVYCYKLFYSAIIAAGVILLLYIARIFSVSEILTLNQISKVLQLSDIQ